jgi:hypothetical protein
MSSILGSRVLSGALRVFEQRVATSPESSLRDQHEPIFHLLALSDIHRSYLLGRIFRLIT